MKETKFAPPCFVLRQQLEFGDSVRLCPAFRRRLPKGLPLFLRGLRGAAPAPAPIYRQPHGLREVLSFADSSRFGRSASPTRPTDGAGAGFPGWPSARGGTGGAGLFGGLTIPLPGPALPVKTATSGHLRRERGSDFTRKLGQFLTWGL